MGERDRVGSDGASLDVFLDAIFEAFRVHSSPTIDYGDAHGERGQPGMIVWRSSHPFIRAEIKDATENFLTKRKRI